LANLDIRPFPAVSLGTVLFQHFVSSANATSETIMRVKLTDTAIRSYQPRSAQYAIGDTACPGLCVRITPKGVKSFAFAYRKPKGRVEWLTIGRYPNVPLARAREVANDARKTVSDGGTPVLRAAAENAKTYAQVVEFYHTERLTGLRSGHTVHTILQRIGRVYGWNDRPIAAISDDAAAAMLADIANRRGKKTMANRVKHLLHALFKWAKQPGRKFISANPFSDLPAPGGPNVSRDRFLTADEIRQLWRALDEPEGLGISRGIATALKLILVTAARPGMVHGMVGSELCDLAGPSAHGPHWSLPAQRMKAGAPFVTPLSGLALELLRPHLKTDPDAPLFPFPRYTLHGAAQRIVRKLGMCRWTPHDLRRTAATTLDREGYSLEQIGALLAHTRKGVTAIYARWDKFDLKREMALVLDRSLRETLQVAVQTAA
jgi:integrase